MDVDHLCGSARTSFCEVAGVELSTAPKRPANSKTVVTRMTWVPYGLRTSQDTARAEYSANIGNLLKAVLLPHLQTRENPAPHLTEVRLGTETPQSPAGRKTLNEDTDDA